MTKDLQVGQEESYRTLIKIIVRQAGSDRLGRNEAGVKKHRPKAYPLLSKPRH